jgi:REP element-mobilizing transposase RayT
MHNKEDAFKITLPKRKHLRLEDYDYSLAGGYFITVCTHDRGCLFGQVMNEQMELNGFGAIVREEWLRSEQMRPNITLDAFMVMPNHFHAIIVIDYPYLGHRRPEDPRQSLERIVAGFKATCTRRINERRRNAPVWQRSFHDEIIRDEWHLGHVRKYIMNNPAQWQFDHENPNRIPQK